MNKIENAIKEVHNIDESSNSNSYLNRIHPLIKLIITIVYIILLTSINKYDLITTLAMGIYIIIISIIGNLSIKISMITLVLKGMFAIIASYFLILTTSIESICSSLKMIHVPNILIFDEPTIALDPKNRRRFINVINSLQETKIITSHDLDLIYDTCTRTILISNGKIIADGETKSILTDEELLENNGLELPLSLVRRN